MSAALPPCAGAALDPVELVAILRDAADDEEAVAFACRLAIYCRAAEQPNIQPRLDRSVTLAAAYRAAAAAIARECWQPIATCPKDGSAFDAWRDGARLPDCIFERGMVVQKIGFPVRTLVFRPQPSHWRPRPCGPRKAHAGLPHISEGH